MRTLIKLSLIAVVIVGCGTNPAPTVIDNGTGGSGDDGSGTGDDGTNPNGPNGKPGDPGKKDPSNPDTPPPPIVDGLTISKIAVLQGVEVDILSGGTWTATRNASLVANRPAMIRVYVTPGSSFKSGTSVTAEIRLASGTTKFPIVSDTKTISKASTDADTSSTFNLDVPATSLPKDATFQINLTAAGAAMPSGTSNGRYPTDGKGKALGLETSGIVRVTVVPVKYMADGSGRVPDTSAAQIDLYKKTMMGRYPATDVQVTVRAPWSYSGSLSGGGSGINNLLNAATNLRESDGVPADMYYYVAFQPTSSFGSYCGGGCITGLSGVVDDARISQMRVSVGIGFTGDESATTMAHEVGHAHGRNHAPCGGAAGVDPQFPYSDASIGVYGYNIIDKTLYSPTQYTDMMGYCDPVWVSDYTFSALFDRVSEVNQLYPIPGGPGGKTRDPEAGAQTYRVAAVDGEGNIQWIGGEEKLDSPPRGGNLRVATFASGAATIAQHDAHFYPYDHLPGGVLVVPAVETAAWTHVHIAGAKPLAR
jgi:hypothetical protein